MYLLSYIRGDFVYCPVLLVLFKPGEGLLIYENVILPFRNPIPQRSQLYKIMTTRLGEGETV